MTFEHYERMGALPHFNPDSDREGDALPAEVAELRRAVAAADALLISTPEYMHGLPGSFKNVLDWLVSDPAFVGKHVVILQAARGSTWALNALREVLRTMSADVIETASISLPLGSNQLDEEAILARDDLRALLLHSVAAVSAVLAKELDRSSKPTLPAVTPPVIDQTVDADEALAVLDRFTEAFNRQDVAGMDATLHFPHVFPGSPPVIWLRAGSVPSDFFPRLVASGWAFSRYTKKEVVLAGPECVHVRVEYDRCRADGSVLSRQAALWILARIDGRWGVQVRSNR